MDVILRLLLVRGTEPWDLSLGLIHVVFGAHLQMEQAAQAEPRTRADRPTDVGLVLRVCVERAAPVYHAHATSHQERNGAAGGNDVIADSAAAGEDVGVFTLISESAGSHLEVTGGIRTGKFEPKPVPQHDPEPATQREAHLLLELF